MKQGDWSDCEHYRLHTEHPQTPVIPRKGLIMKTTKHHWHQCRMMGGCDQTVLQYK